MLQEFREDVPGLRRSQVESVVGIAVHGHDTVDLDVHVMDEWNQPVEPLRHGRAPAEGAHVLQLVQDEQDE
jgi:hypothetical protein